MQLKPNYYGNGEGNSNLLWCSCLENPHEQRSLVGCSPWGSQRVGQNQVTQHTMGNMDRIDKRIHPDNVKYEDVIIIKQEMQGKNKKSHIQGKKRKCKLEENRPTIQKVLNYLFKLRMDILSRLSEGKCVFLDLGCQNPA